MNFFGMDGLLIFFILLLLFGAKKLPELARGMGQAVKEFSKAKDEFNNEIARPTPPTPSPQLDQPKATTPEVVVEHHEQRDESHAPHTPVI